MSIKSFFQTPYNWIKNWAAPTWLKNLLQELNDLLFLILKQVSQQYINYLQEKIIEAASHNDWSNEKKFDYVFKAAKDGFINFAVTLKDSEINALINWLVLKLKRGGAIA